MSRPVGKGFAAERRTREYPKKEKATTRSPIIRDLLVGNQLNATDAMEIEHRMRIEF
jgi:hypothetical protein